MRHQLIGDLGLQEILDRGSSWALVAFTSWGSIPCNHFRPEFCAIAGHFRADIYCAEISMDENPSIADRLKIMAVPTTLLLHRGKEVRRFEGPYSQEALIKRVTRLLRA